MPPAPAPAIMLDGLFAGSLVETPDGWSRVEHLRPGDLVLAADGPATVLAVEEGLFTRLPLRPALWPLFVPARALGNGEPVALTPWQSVPVPAGTDGHGGRGHGADGLGTRKGGAAGAGGRGAVGHGARGSPDPAPCARIPAAVLAPWRGIERFRPPAAARVLRPVFARTEVISIGHGLRVVCLGFDARGGPGAVPPDLGRDAAACVIARLVAADLGPFLLAPA